MSNVKLVPLIELFHFPAINGLTQSFIMKNPGEIPVYGGRKTESPIGFVKEGLKDVKYFTNCLGWNREGSVGYVFWHKNTFTTNDHHRPMILREEYKDCIFLGYMQLIIENKLLSLGFEWSITASKEKVKDISVGIPIDNKGRFDINRQKFIYNKFKRINSIQHQFKDYYSTLKESFVIFEEDYPKKTVSLSNEEIFSLSIGKRVLKKDVQPEGIPAYSANVSIPFGFVNDSKLTDFSTPSLIWGIDGNFDWSLLPKNYKFAPTDHCGVLRLKIDTILPEYLLYTLKKDKDSYGFDRTFRASLRNIKENVTVEIPIDCSGKFDIHRQKEVINKQKRIDNIRNFLCTELDKLSKVTIEYSE